MPGGERVCAWWAGDFWRPALGATRSQLLGPFVSRTRLHERLCHHAGLPVVHPGALAFG